MKISGRQRRIILATALILTLVVGWGGKVENSASAVAASQPAVRADRRESKDTRNTAVPVPGLRLELLSRQPMKIRSEEMFAGKSWYVPPPPPPPAPPPLPTPPSLPFIYLGKLLEGDKSTVFLTKLNRNYSVKPGDVIEDTYRVEDVTAGVMTLTYMPLNMKQTLYIGGTN